MSATPDIEADTIPAGLMDGDNTAAAFAEFQSGASNWMQVEDNPPQGPSRPDIPEPAPLSYENCGPPGGSGQDMVNGCEP